MQYYAILFYEVNMNIRLYKNKALTITTTALFLSLGVIFPQLFHALGLGTAFSPMHLPVLLCGLMCGGFLGALVGFATPFISSFIFSMPPLFPNAVVMSIELAAYGLLIGLFYRFFKNKKKDFFKKTAVVFSLIIAMAGGRILYGILMWLIVFAQGGIYSLNVFLTAVIIGCWPGLVLQITSIPLIMIVLSKTHTLLKYDSFTDSKSYD
mgnify:CR=1 FL=1